MTDKQLSEMARTLGRKGGEANKKKGKEYFSMIGKYANQVRWAGHVKKG